jgi:formiminotetrahydrofolate cyclodeaminase
MSLTCDSNKDMKSTVSNSTVESLRGHIAGAKDPIMAGVAVSAVSDAVNQESVRLVRYADQDIAAYQNYRDSLKRKRGIEAALRRIIETPLEAASSAVRGLDLCVEAVSLVPLSVASDLGAAETLLAGAVRAILLTVDVNLLQLPAKSELRRGASRQVEKIVGKLVRLTKQS